MIVTKICNSSKSRFEIFIDDEFAFVLYKGELRLYGIEIGKEISSEHYNEITKKVLPKRAKLRAMNLLTKRDYSEYQLRKKLEEGEYSQEIVEEAIEYVKSFHYIDDTRYAKEYIRVYMESKSKMRILLDLSQKGISKETVQRCYDEMVGDDENEVEMSQIRTLLQKKKYNASTATYEEKAKISAYLYRKGFSQGMISKALLLDITNDCV